MKTKLFILVCLFCTLLINVVAIEPPKDGEVENDRSWGSWVSGWGFGGDEKESSEGWGTKVICNGDNNKGEKGEGDNGANDDGEGETEGPWERKS